MVVINLQVIASLVLALFFPPFPVKDPGRNGLTKVYQCSSKYTNSC
jgi:hypothetical protein